MQVRCNSKLRLIILLNPVYPIIKKYTLRRLFQKINLISDNLENTRDVTHNLVSAMVNLIQIQNSYTANANVVRTAEELVGTFLDIMA